MTSVDTLSALDAQFLYWDSDDTPMCMGSLCLFEGDPLFDDDGCFRLAEVRRAIESRLHLVPRYRRKVFALPGKLAHPVLVDDPDFAIENHVRLGTLPPPGNETQLKEVYSRTHEGMLDRRRPLWELTFVAGLDDGRVGLIQKIHHAPFDGESTVDIMDLLFDTSPDVTAVEPPPWHPEPPPNPVRLVPAQWIDQASGIWSRLRTPQPLGELARATQSLSALLPLPPTSLNRAVGPRRRFDWVSTTLTEAREIRTLVPGATVNDAMLAVVTGGLRALFTARGEDVDDLVLRAMIPMSLRSELDDADATGNLISAFVAPLPVGEPTASSACAASTSRPRS